MRKLIIGLVLAVTMSGAAQAYDWEASSRAYDRSQQQYYQVQRQRQQQQMLYEMRRQREAMERQQRENYRPSWYDSNGPCLGC